MSVIFVWAAVAPRSDAMPAVDDLGPEWEYVREHPAWPDLYLYKRKGA